MSTRLRVKCKRPPAITAVALSEIGESFADAFSPPPFTSGFGREEDEDGPSPPPPFQTLEAGGFKSEPSGLPARFRDPQPPKLRRPRRPFPTVGGTGSDGDGGVAADFDDYPLYPPLAPPPPIPPSSATAAAPTSPTGPAPIPPHPHSPQHDDAHRDSFRIHSLLDPRFARSFELQLELCYSGFINQDSDLKQNFFPLGIQ